MSERHYLIIKKDDKVIYETQILGNNDYFDNIFYDNLNLVLDKNYTFNETKINLHDLIYEWNLWLNRHPNKKGINLNIDKENTLSDKERKELLLLNYRLANFYELQPFLLIHDLDIKEYLNLIDSTLKDGYELYITIY